MRGICQNILGQCPILLLGLLLLSIPASATSTSWSETLDIAVSTAPPRSPVMLCVVDTADQLSPSPRRHPLTCRPGVADGRYVLVGRSGSSHHARVPPHVSLVLSPSLQMLLGCYCLNSTPLCLVCHVTLWWKE